MQWNTTSTVTTQRTDAAAATTAAEHTQTRRDEALATAEIGVQIVIFLLALLGNGLVLGMLAAISRRKDLGRMYTMIGHLSCADVFVAIFNLLPQVRRSVSYYGGTLSERPCYILPMFFSYFFNSRLSWPNG